MGIDQEHAHMNGKNENSPTSMASEKGYDSEGNPPRISILYNSSIGVRQSQLVLTHRAKKIL